MVARGNQQYGQGTIVPRQVFIHSVITLATNCGGLATDIVD